MQKTQGGAVQAPVIETARLRLRGHRADDLAACAAMWADPVVSRFIGGRGASEEEVWARILRYAGLWALLGFGYWAIEDKASGRFVGEAGAWPGPRHRSGGGGARLGRRAVRAVTDGLPDRSGKPSLPAHRRENRLPGIRPRHLQGDADDPVPSRGTGGPHALTRLASRRRRFPNEQGNLHAFLLTPVPEPGTLVIFGVGLLALLLVGGQKTPEGGGAAITETDTAPRAESALVFLPILVHIPPIEFWPDD